MSLSSGTTPFRKSWKSTSALCLLMVTIVKAALIKISPRQESNVLLGKVPCARMEPVSWESRSLMKIESPPLHERRLGFNNRVSLNGSERQWLVQGTKPGISTS